MKKVGSNRSLILRVLLRVCMPVSMGLLSIFHVCAEEAPDTVISLKNVTVTAAPRKLATVQKLSGADLQSLSTTTIADALKYFAGVQIKDYGGLGGLKTINVRSLGAQHVGVYIDGIRITNAQNGTVDLGKYSLSTLESISLYNANKLDACQSASEYASGATVYMQTRRPDSDSVSVTARVASFHTYMGRVNARMCRNGWSGFVDAEYLSSKGDYTFRYKSEYEDTVGRRSNSDIEYTRVEAALFKGGFASHLYFYRSERGCPGGIVRRLSDKYNNVGREWDSDLFAQTSWKHSFNDKFSMKANARYAYEYLRYCTDYPENQNTAKVNNHYHHPEASAFFPGDEVTVQYSGLFHPANKLAGIYNMSAYVTYNGNPNGTALILGSNQYTFGSAPKAQAVTFTIPEDYDADSNPEFILNEGVIQVKGFGDPIGNHRNISRFAGRSPNFNAAAHQTYFGAIPEVRIPVSSSTSGISGVIDTDDVQIVAYYNLQGIASDTPRKGMNIVVYSDGTTRKIMVK